MTASHVPERRDAPGSNGAPGFGVALARVPALDLAVTVLVFLALVALWTKVQPFPDLKDYAIRDAAVRSSEIRKYVTLLIAFAGMGLLWVRGRFWLTLHAVTLPLVLVFAWFGVTSVLADARGLALNRIVLAGVVVVICAAVPLLFERMRTYLVTIGAATGAMIGLSYAGVLFAPDLAIHSGRDVAEQVLAGDWRGVFAHKNDMAPMMVMAVFTGILLTRLGHIVWGPVTVVLAFVLLVQSGGKTANLLILPVIVTAMFAVRVPSRLLSAVACLSLVLGLAAVTIGSVLFKPLGQLVKALPDPTFTGRSDIWDHVMQAATAFGLWTRGQGYYTFWDTGGMARFAGPESSVAQISHSHNGYLELILAAGAPGLVLVLVWVGVGPWAALEAIKRRELGRTEKAVADYFVQTWLFMLLISFLEVMLFNRGDPIWITGLLAVTCLRYWARSGRLIL